MPSYRPRNGDNARHRGSRRYYDDYKDEGGYDSYDSLDEYEAFASRYRDEYDNRAAYNGRKRNDDNRSRAIVPRPPGPPPPSTRQIVPFVQPERRATMRKKKDKSKSKRSIFNRNKVRFADDHRDNRDDYYYDDRRHRLSNVVREQREEGRADRRPGLAEATLTCCGQDIFFNIYKQDDDDNESLDESLDNIAAVPRNIMVSEANTSEGSNQLHRKTVSFARTATSSFRDARDGLNCFHDDVQSGFQYLQDDTLKMMTTSGIDPEQYRQILLRQIEQSKSLLQLPVEETIESGAVPDDLSVQSGVEVALNCAPTSTRTPDGGVMDTVMSTKSYKTTGTTKASTSSSSGKVRSQKKWKRSTKAEF